MAALQQTPITFRSRSPPSAQISIHRTSQLTLSSSFIKLPKLKIKLRSTPLRRRGALGATMVDTVASRRFRHQASTSSGLDNIDNNILLKESIDEEGENPDPNGIGVMQVSQNQQVQQDPTISSGTKTSSANVAVDKDLKKVVQKTATTFAPRASVASKNPAVPGTTLYTVFEVQAYASMLLGGAISFNLIFPSNDPDIWRLMGMWSIWMFTIPSLRARDCSKNEKEALNYLFLLVPLLNVTIPFFWKSFAVVWSADTVAFFAMYAWKLGWLQKAENE